MQAFPKNSRRAFTILEVLVSVAVLSLIVLTLTSVIDQAGKNWRRGFDRTDKRTNERALTSFIAEEIAGALLPVDRFSDPAKPNLEFILNPGRVTHRNASAVFFQAPIPTDSTAGDIPAIGYFVRWIGTKAVLCRMVISPSDANYGVYTTLNWINDTLLDAVAPADTANDYRGFFVENVIGFWVQCFKSDGTAWTGNSGSSRPGTPGQAHTLPTSVEISIVTIDSATAARITDADKTSIIADVQAAANAEAFVAGSLPPILQCKCWPYTTRITLRNAR
jgi:prepilin-type N-terminal cleavage/methylation domain-containing protein